jgi:type VI protein secretion system component VasK
MDRMTDLRIDDVTTAGAVAGLRAAANRLAPVIRALRALDTEVTGANALADELDQADQSLAAVLDNLGRELAGLATWIDGAAAGLASTDRTLAAEASQ